MKDNLYHPTAIISNKAQIGENVKIGPYSIIEDDVVIGDNTVLLNGVVIANGARIGKDCLIYPYTVIATEPQDLKFKNEKTYVHIGDRNVIREYTTINRGTIDTGHTIIGNDCLLMAYSHVAHDCLLGSNVILSNVTQLGGHVTVEDWVIFGGVAKVHQFCVVGKHSFIGADVKVVKDVAPYTLIGNTPPQVEGINRIGLRRRGFPEDIIDEIDKFYKTVLHSGINNSAGIAKFRENGKISPEVEYCIEFIEKSERGIYR